MKFIYVSFIKFIDNKKIIITKIIKKTFIEFKNINFEFLNKSNSFLKSETLFNLKRLNNFL